VSARGRGMVRRSIGIDDAADPVPEVGQSLAG
jgi:hypothetical protein